MIQRIQSLYLFLVAILTGLMFQWPFADFLVEHTVYFFKAKAIVAEDHSFLLVKTWPVAILLAMVIGVVLVAIFLYKNRSLQMRFTVFAILLNIGFYGLFYYYYHQAMSVKALSFSLDWGLPMPLVNIILLILAYKGIKADDEKIKSLDRIR